LIFFGDFTSAANLALQCGDNYDKALPSHFFVMLETIHPDVALYAMAPKRPKLYLYQETIVSGARTGHLHHAALCSERYADLLRKELVDEDQAKHRIEEAIRFYSDWGAEAKVEMLMDPLK
jgi:hypothetical protein